jgi:hypothetical protein
MKDRKSYIYILDNNEPLQKFTPRAFGVSNAVAKDLNDTALEEGFRIFKLDAPFDGLIMPSLERTEDVPSIFSE